MTLRFNEENRLVEVSGAILRSTFVYDGLGRRVERIDTPVSGSATITRYVYDGWRVVEETNASGATLRFYTRGMDLSGSFENAGGIGGLLAITRSNGGGLTSASYIYDGNGNVTGLVGSDGTALAQYRFDPFGQRLSAIGAWADLNPYQFSSKERDDWTGFYYYGLRYYNPSTGRWLSRDPLEEGGGTNLYGAAVNDMVCRFDPNGLWTQQGVEAILCRSDEGQLVMADLQSGKFKVGSVDDWMLTFQVVDKDGHPMGPEGITKPAKKYRLRINGTIQQGILWIMSDLSDEFAAKDIFHEHDHTSLPDEPVSPYDQFLQRRLEHEIQVRYESEIFAAAYNIAHPKLPPLPIDSDYWVNGGLSIQEIRKRIMAEAMYNPSLTATSGGDIIVPKPKSPINPTIITNWQGCCNKTP
jgi:RHS repeat-associated protein